MYKVNRKNSRAVLMLNKYQNINTEVMYSIQEFNEDIKLRYIVVLGGFFICFCMKTKLYRNESGIFLFSPPRELFPVIYVQFLQKRQFTDLWVY
jgi:hypothetical protein